MDIEIKEEPIDQETILESESHLEVRIKIEEDFEAGGPGPCNNDPLLEIEVKNEEIQVTADSKLRQTNKIRRKEANNPTESKPKEKKVNTRIYQCPICNIIKTTRSYLTSHMRNVHTDVRKFECTQCHDKFKTSQSLKKHQLVHTVERKFKCSHCELSFKDDYTLKKHSALVHEGLKRFICSVCGKDFGRADYLEKHLLTHSEERNFKCEICGDAFKVGDTLKTHKKTVHDDIGDGSNKNQNKNCCHICGKSFNLPFHLREHLERHQDVRRFKCDFCEKGFNSKSNLRQHRSIHLNERKFQCHLCEKAFNLKIGLNQHLRTHADYCPEKTSDKYRRKKGKRVERLDVSIKEDASAERDSKDVDEPKINQTSDPIIPGNSNPENEPAVASEKTNKFKENYPKDVVQKSTEKKTLKHSVMNDDPENKRIKTEKLEVALDPDFVLENLEESGIQRVFVKSEPTNFIEELESPKNDQTVRKIKRKGRKGSGQAAQEIKICPECGKCFKNSSNFKRHASVHINSRDIPCTNCDLRFKDNSALNQHLRLKHNENSKSYECDFCGKIFKRRDYLVKHFTVHSDSRKFICEACGSFFKTADSLNTHVKFSHSCESGKNIHAKHSCMICGKSFAIAFHLREHLDRHQDAKRYKCDFCEKGFNTKSNLNQHRSSHLNEKKYKCHLCEKAFNLKNGLNQHLKTHNGTWSIGQESLNPNRKFHARLKKLEGAENE